MARIVPWTEACEPARGAWGPLYKTLLTLFLSDTVFLWLFKCLFVFPLEVLLFLFAPTHVFLVRFFVRLEGEGVSRVSIARGRRCSQARYPSVLEGLEAPRLLDRSRFTK